MSAQLPDIAELQSVMRQISDGLEDIAQPGLMPNALLNLAVERMLAEQQPESVATILQRLAGLIAAGQRPAGSDAIALTGHNA